MKDIPYPEGRARRNTNREEKVAYLVLWKLAGSVVRVRAAIYSAIFAFG